MFQLYLSGKELWWSRILHVHNACFSNNFNKLACIYYSAFSFVTDLLCKWKNTCTSTTTALCVRHAHTNSVGWTDKIRRDNRMCAVKVIATLQQPFFLLHTVLSQHPSKFSCKPNQLAPCCTQGLVAQVTECQVKNWKKWVVYCSE